MQNNLYELHKNCEMLVNYVRTNTHGRPSLCCATCKDKHGRPQWIDWISKENEDYLIEGLCVDVVGESQDTVGQALNIREFLKKNAI